MKRIIVCGGAGYIGSHVTLELLKQDYDVIVIDDLSAGHRECLHRMEEICGKMPMFYECSIQSEKMREIFKKHAPIDCVMHFCALTSVPESCKEPLMYYENNVVATVKLLQCLKEFDVKRFIFSSTAALFGNPVKVPIDADDETIPINPYGETKLTVEKLLKSCDEAWGLKYVSLRYFNACGADDSGKIGEDHHPECHLIPLILQVALGKRDQIYIFGSDYDTKDGTCVRDYVHVTDLAHAHIKAIEFLRKENKSDVFNLGTNTGYSVKEVISACRKVTNHEIPTVLSERRPGDAPSLIASSKKAENGLGWKIQYDSIEKICKSAWKWHYNNPNGYEIKKE